MEKWIGRYIELVNDLNIPYKDIHKIIDDFFPNKLYRYRKFGEYWSDEIFNGQVYMAFANEFNDPFDSLFYINVDEYENRISNEVNKLFESIGKEKIKKALRAVFPSQIELLKLKFQNYIRIGCFSATNHSIQMWSHYADNHKGFCIEYDLQKINKNIKENLLPVIYQKNRYEASMCLATHNYNIAYNPALYKANEWSYESEWRIFSTINQYNKEKGECAMLDGSISAIYLGAKCYEEDKITQIKNWARKKEIPLHKMKMSSLEYKLYTDII